MTTSASLIGVFILAKNESANIVRSLQALAATDWAIHVLDSGSTDGTQALAEQYANVVVMPYKYVDHCTAYNDITTNLGKAFELAIILDADMMVAELLQSEIAAKFESGMGQCDVLRASIDMWVDGYPVLRGSLCPPKPIAFKTGAPLFVSTGHAEKLADNVRVFDLKAHLIHDDRKNYSSFLQSQVRYADKLVSRFQQGAVSGRDRLRVRTPLLIAIVPFVSYVLKGGFLAGRAGVLYALDRLIAEAIMYRRSVAMRLQTGKSTK